MTTKAIVQLTTYILCAISCLSQSRLNDLQEEKLVGKPTKVVERVFELSGERYERRTSEIETTFDEFGNYLSWKSENLVSGEIKTKKYSNNYGAGDLLLSRSEHRTYNWGTWEGSGKTEYEYDPQGQLINEKRYTADGELRYTLKFSCTNNSVETKWYNKQGELFEKQLTTRNNRNVVRVEHYKKAYGELKPETISNLSYDAKNNVNRIDYEYTVGSKNTYDPRYKAMRFEPDLYDYEYNEQNQIKGRYQYRVKNGEKTVIEIIEFKYYDQQGNWTEKIQWMFKAEANALAPSTVYRRSITY